ncbi:MAG: hypothetical protein ABL929_11845, partial [Ferruginibacter sp.]
FETIINKLDAIEITVNSFVSSESKKTNSEGQNSENDFIDLAAACVFLKMPVSTLHFHKKHHALPFLKPGKRLVFKKSSLLKWMENFNVEGFPATLNTLSPILQNRKRYAK